MRQESAPKKETTPLKRSIIFYLAIMIIFIRLGNILITIEHSKSKMAIKTTQNPFFMDEVERVRVRVRKKKLKLVTN